MDKRSLAAIALSLSVLILYQMFFVKPAPQQPETSPAAINAPVTGTAPAPAVQAPAAPEETAAVEAKTVTVETDLYTAVFNTKGATVKEWQLRQYKDDNGAPVQMMSPGGPYGALAFGWEDNYNILMKDFSVTRDKLDLSTSRPSGSLTFTLTGPEYTIRRTMTFNNESYAVEVRDEVEGPPQHQVTLGGELGIHSKKAAYSHVGPVILDGSDREEYNAKKLAKGPRYHSEDVNFVAIEDKYFCAALVPKEAKFKAVAWQKQDSSAVALIGEAGVQEYTLYVGPKVQEELDKVGRGLQHILDFGFFSVISRPIFWLLKKIYSIVGNYGWAIIILTIIVRIPFLPIINKGQKSMKRMQKVQPLMQEIREKYKKDPQKMQKEMMGLYKKHKVNPMGGCLPMLLQIPVFFALYKVLMIAIELRGAPWALWITDLSVKDPFYVLPIVMGASMFLQQKMTPTPGDPKQQKIMMFMPIIFTFIFLNFASGLVLYWLTNNILAIVQQFFVNRKKED